MGGDGKRNPVALHHKAQGPKMEAIGLIAGAELKALKVLKKNIIIVAPEHVRTVNGVTEVFGQHPQVVNGEIVLAAVPDWGPPREGLRVVPAGTMLNDEDHDMVIGVFSTLIDNRVVNSRGQAEGTGILVYELARIDFKTWLQAHADARKNSVPPGRLI